MQLAALNHTQGNTLRWEVDYSAWLGDGRTVTAFATVSSSDTLSVSGATHTSMLGIFFVAGGTLGEVATVTVTMTDSLGQIKHDTVVYTVIAP